MLGGTLKMYLIQPLFRVNNSIFIYFMEKLLTHNVLFTTDFLFRATNLHLNHLQSHNSAAIVL